MSGENTPARRREAEDLKCPPGRLLELTADDSFFVRRAARAHPALPRSAIELWVRAGSTEDLAGFGPPDPTLPAAELARLASLGPWGERLAARHPATEAETLERLAGHPSAALRADLASHPEASRKLLEALVFDVDSEVRARAAANPHAPAEQLALLERATSLHTTLGDDERARLAASGTQGRRLLAHRPELSPEECARLAEDADAEVRRALLSHPNLPAKALARAVEAGEGELEVWALAAAHPAASPELLTWLALHGPAPVRQAAATHGAFPQETRRMLVRAGASPDIAGFGPPDPALEGRELSKLAHAGAWARLLAARHPKTSPEDLSHLLADADPLVRQAAAAHPDRPHEAFVLLLAAGSTPELDGFERGTRAALTPGSLEQLANLGPWGHRLAARHPEATAELLERLAHHDEALVRAEVAANPQASPETLLALAGDLSTAVRWAVARRSELPELALTELARSPEATIRARVASHAGTPLALRQRLARDPDEEVRRIAESQSVQRLRELEDQLGTFENVMPLEELLALRQQG